MLLPSFSSLAASGAVCNDIQTCAMMLVDLIDSVIPILIGIALILFIYGLYKYFFVGGNEAELTKAKSYIVYGIVSLAVIIGVWGLVGVFSKAFFPGQVKIPQFKL